MPGEEVDRVALQRDAMLVHALATRTLPADEVDIHDPIVGYLAAWVDWVDESVEEDAVFDLTEVTGGKDRIAQARAKRHSRAALIAGSTVAVLVVSSGAAAAVTGDPFLVAKAPLEVLQQVNPFDDDEHDSRETLPEHTPDVAKANKLLADAQRALAQGNPQKAERLVDEAKTLLGDSASPGQKIRIEHLVETIATGNSGDPAEPNEGGAGQPDDPGSQGQHKGDGKGNDTQGPTDKDPVDKDQKGQGQDKDPVDNDPSAGAGDTDRDTGQDPGSGDDPGKGQGSGKSGAQPEDPGASGSGIAPRGEGSSGSQKSQSSDA